MIINIIAQIITAGVFVLLALVLTFLIVVAYKAVRLVLSPDLRARHQHAKKVAGFTADSNGVVTK